MNKNLRISKKLTMGILAVLVIAAVCFTPWRMTSAIAMSDIGVTVDGESVVFPSGYGEPYIDLNNRTLVPLRGVMEAFGAAVSWDDDTGTATVEKNGITVQVPIGYTYILVNGVSVTNDTSAVIKDGRTYLPIRAVLEAFGADVSWDNVNGIVVVKTKSADDNPAEQSNNYQAVNILASPRATVEQAKNWAKSNGATDVFISLADIYWEISIKSGVDPAVAYVQSAKETNFGKFTGVLDESFCNPCGLKGSGGGDDYAKDAHQVFNSWEEGIQAHVDHLALYAGARGYPKASTPDPRHFPSLMGTAVTVEALGEKWAPSLLYGTDIVQRMTELESASNIYTP